MREFINHNTNIDIVGFRDWEQFTIGGGSYRRNTGNAERRTNTETSRGRKKEKDVNRQRHATNRKYRWYVLRVCTTSSNLDDTDTASLKVWDCGREYHCMYKQKGVVC